MTATLYLHGNSLDGTIPEGITHIKTLVDLRLSDNRLTGSLPGGLVDMSKLGK